MNIYEQLWWDIVWYWPRKFLKSNSRQHGQMEKQDGKAEVKREEKKKEDQRRESQKKEDPGAWKGTKVVKHCVFWKVGSLKRRVRSHLGRWEMKRSTFRHEKCEKHNMFAPLLDVQMLRCGEKHLSKAKRYKRCIACSDHFPTVQR